MKGYVGPHALVRLVWDGLRLYAPSYREVSRAEESTRLCLAVSVLGGAVSGLSRGPALGLVPVVAVIFYIVVTLAVLCFESFLVWGAARIWLRPGASWMEVLRPIALANAPRLADVLLTLGQGEALLAPLCGGWQLAAFVVGVEAAVSRGWAIALGLTLSIGVFRWLLFALLIGA